MAAAANAGTNTELGQILQTLGFSPAIRLFIRDREGLSTLQDVNQLHKDLVETVFKNMQVADPVVPYTTVLLSRFKTLHSYLRRCANMRIPIIPGGITIDLLLQELEYAEDPRSNKEVDKKVPFPTEEFVRDSDWLSFKDSFKNYLNSVPSARARTNLSYVIRPIVVPPEADLTDNMWTVALNGRDFQDDNRLVYTYLEKLTRAGIGKTIVANFSITRNGRAAFLALDSQFTGGAYKTLLLNAAWDTLHTTKFFGQVNFTWAQYKSEMEEAFRKLIEAGVTGLDDSTRVYHLTNGILVDYLDEPINHVRQNLSNDYFAASNHISGAVLTKLSKTSYQRNRPKERGISHVSARDYTDEEWRNLSAEERQQVQRLRSAAQNHNNHGSAQNGNRSGGGRQTRNGGRSRGRGRYGGRGGQRSGQRNGSNAPGHFPRGNDYYGPAQGRNGGRMAQRNGQGGIRQVQQVATQQYDYGDYDEIPEEEWYEQCDGYDASGVNDPNHVIEPNTQTENEHLKWRRVGAFNVRLIGSVTSDTGGTMECDSHADNCMLGRDARVLETYEGRRYTIYGYKKDSHVERYLSKACVAYDDVASGISFILVFDQVFVDPDLSSSLICPNQLRANGLIVEDVPVRYKKDSSHSITAGNLKIPLYSKGYVSYFNVRTPSDEEIEFLEHVIMTGSDWDPHSDEHQLLEKAATASAVQATSTFAVDPNLLAKLWLVAPSQAEATLKSTTILANKIFNEPRYSSYSHRFRQLTRRHLKGRFWTDTFFAVKSATGFNCAQLFANEMRYLHVVAMRGRGEAPYALRHFFDHVGLPDLIISDNAMEQSSEAWRSVLREFGVLERKTEPYKHHQNYSENAIKLLKFRCAKLVERKGVPNVYWDHVVHYMFNLSNRLIHKTPRLEGRTPHEWVHGVTPDISAFITFSFYEYVYYTVQPKQLFPNPKRKIGRWLGPSKSTVCDLVYNILSASGNVVCSSAVEPISLAEMDTVAIQEMVKEFDLSLNENMLKNFGPVSTDATVFLFEDGETSSEVLLEEGVDTQVQMIRIHPCDGDSRIDVSNDAPRILATMDAEAVGGIEIPSGSKAGWESARICIPRGEGVRYGTVVHRKRGHDGSVIGESNTNPILDTQVYTVQFDDGMVEEMAANAIAQSIYDNSDENGWGESLVLDEILEHFVSVKKTRSKSTNGWFLLVRWKSGLESVCRLSELKESYPVAIAEYAREHDLLKESAFWWVPYVLKKAKRIISKIKTRNIRLEKFGIKVPRTVEEALRFDRESNTTYWQDAISKEMTNIMVAFQLLGDGERPAPGYEFIKCHFIFDIKLDGSRKARFVADGSRAELPSSITYSSVVSRDSIRILLVIAALNDLEVSCCDIQNAYISAKPREKVYFRAGKEFGSDEGRLVLVVRALYGLKSSGAAFRSMLSSELKEMGYKSCLADPDVYMKARSRADGTTFWEYILCYVDDILYLGLDPKSFMDKLQTVFKLKNGYSSPKTFLGAEFQRFELNENGKTYQFWGLGMNEYIVRAIAEIEARALKDFNLKFPTRIAAPMRPGYHPELDFTQELDDNGVNFYQGLIGTLRWIVEVSRIDLAYAVSVMSSYMSAPRIGHLVEVLHVFAYLRLKPNLSLILDAREPVLKRDLSLCAENSWGDFYPDANESIPSNMPEPRGRAVSTHTFVDADWAGNLANRRSHTGMVLFLQSAPIIWVSKRQKTVETSTYGAEFCAMKYAVEMIDGVRYKLRMMGIPIQGSTLVYCDNESVVHNLSNPESTLKKKHVSIAFHKTRESVASKAVEVHRVKSDLNTSDILTKTLSGSKTEYHTSNLLLDNASNTVK